MAIVLGDRLVNVSPPAGSGPYACPCCGYLTLDARGEHETCQIGSWDDDGHDDLDATVVRGGPNKTSASPRHGTTSPSGSAGRQPGNRPQMASLRQTGGAP
ncbi:CPCC family cysteine-rich protein [Amycolatopsis sp. NPDC089917]|uniref:CPCC family cysteine-rich protein n=1 Tax=Amycolatopsis sp. NPDC089917 TaxID=3155187 RepID=UPI0034177560